MKGTRAFLRAAHPLLLIWLVHSPTLSAVERQFALDPEKTSITFTLKATMHTVEGSASLVSGTILVEPETGRAEGEVVVDATTAETGNGARDKKMHNKVLLSETYPVITFRIHRVEGAITASGRAELVLAGEMELLGRSHDIRVPATVEIDGDRFTAEARYVVPYVDWGLEDPSTFLLRVAREVPVAITTEGSLAEITTAP